MVTTARMDDPTTSIDETDRLDAPGCDRAAVSGNSPAHVIVIEDSADIGRLIEVLLCSLGARVTLHAEPRPVLALIENGEPPDLLVVDRMLPHVSGDELIRRARARAPWASVPIVVVSAKTQALDDGEHALDGANVCLAKPFRVEHFLATIRRFL